MSGYAKNGLKQAALAYAGNGWRVFPCRPRGKVPLTLHGSKDATTDTRRVAAWWSRWPDANIGTPTGKRFTVLDLDGPSAVTALESLGDEHGEPVPHTLTATTGRGEHRYFAPAGLRNSAGTIAPHVDVRGDGGYVILPPSVHQTGKVYEWADGDPFSENWQELPQLPAWVAEAAQGKPRSNHSPGRRPATGALGKVREGRRNTSLTELAGAIRRRGMDFDAINAALQVHNSSHMDPPLPQAEVAKIARSVCRYEPATESEMDPLVAQHHTDQGNAERLVAFAGDRLRYCYPLRAWLYWDGGRWKRADNGEERLIAKDLVLKLHAITPHLPDGRRERHADNARALESVKRMATMLEAARPLLPVAVEDLDAKPDLLNVRNGTLELATGRIREARREDLLTQQAAVSYDPEAKCPTWEAAFRTIFGGNARMIAFLQRCMAYSITGRTDEQCFFLAHGDGANGKTTLLECLLWLLGDYATKASAHTFLESKRSGGASEDVAALRGIRFAPAVEPDAGKALAESLVKQATGGETIRTRRLYENSWTFKPMFKLWLACNRLPRVRGLDHGIWRRIVTIPFRHVIPEGQRDRRILGRLQAEGSGILNWLLAGLEDYGECGLAPPPEAVQDREDYCRSEDHIARWLNDCCLEGRSHQVRNKELRQAYERWCSENAETAFGNIAWHDELKAKGFQQVKIHGWATWKGIGLASPEDDTNADATPSPLPERQLPV